MKDPIAKAISACSKPLRFRSEKALAQNLEFAAGSMAEAYQIGAQEAQQEMLRRLHKLVPKPATLMYEDDLPPIMTPTDYDRWYQQSVVVDGVRMGPRIK